MNVNMKAEIADAVDALVIAYNELAVKTKQPLSYRSDPALVEAAALVDKLRDGKTEQEAREIVNDVLGNQRDRDGVWIPDSWRADMIGKVAEALFQRDQRIVRLEALCRVLEAGQS